MKDKTYEYFVSYTYLYNGYRNFDNTVLTFDMNRPTEKIIREVENYLSQQLNPDYVKNLVVLNFTCLGEKIADDFDIIITDKTNKEKTTAEELGILGE